MHVSMLLLAPAPEGYVAPQMRHDVSQVHLVADLMAVWWSWMNEKWRRTSLCSLAHTDLAQHTSQLLAKDGLSSASTCRLFHQMTPMNRQAVQEYSGRIWTSTWPSLVGVWQQRALSGDDWKSMKSNETPRPVDAPHKASSRHQESWVDPDAACTSL